jgi:LacI family transcriptional regulator
MASLKTLALSLGLSITTVSRALAGYGDVAAATRARVKRAAEAAGYRPHPIARRLQRGRAEAVGVVLPADPGHFTDPFFTELLVGLGEALARVELDLIVTAARPGAEEMKVYRRLVEGRRVDGMIVARTRVNDARIRYLQAQNFPFVAHGRTATRRAYAFVDADGESAMEHATRRLIGLGHDRIALINARPSLMFARHRAQGWRGALAAEGIAPGPMLAADATEENGYLLARRLLELPQRPTAILCATDRLAVGALRAIASAGLVVPRDISVIGYDDLPIATYSDPPLTTVAMPVRRMAARLVAVLTARIAGEPASRFHEIWPLRLVTRASDGPAPASIQLTATKKPIAGGTHVATESDHAV